ncbi:MAG: hypothetical protein ACK559_32000, partial [bacterium]
MGLQEPELEDLVGVDGGDGLDDVHHLGEMFLRKGGDQQVEHHTLAGDVAGTKFRLRKGEPGRRLRNPECRQG